MRQRPILRWTPNNIAHIVRHGVRPTEAAEAADAAVLIEPSYGGRHLLVGPTQAGRILAAVVEPGLPGVYLVVTARPASRKERRRLERDGAGGSWWTIERTAGC